MFLITTEKREGLVHFYYNHGVRNPYSPEFYKQESHVCVKFGSHANERCGERGVYETVDGLADLVTRFDETGMSSGIEDKERFWLHCPARNFAILVELENTVVIQKKRSTVTRHLYAIVTSLGEESLAKPFGRESQRKFLVGEDLLSFESVDSKASSQLELA